MGSVNTILKNIDFTKYRSDLNKIASFTRDSTAKKNINLAEKVGRGYKTFWNFKGRYRILKGSRASKKSKTTSLWYIYNIMKYPDANLLVTRKTYRTLKDSCFADLEWSAYRLGVHNLFNFKSNPLEIEYKKTGQKILFRGLDDSLKVTSISVPKGYLCWEWLEEAYEVLNEDDFKTLDESIRGRIEDDKLFKQITLTLNPWNDKHWIKHRFFDEMLGYDNNGSPIYVPRKNIISADGDILAMTTNYMCNEWLDESDLKMFERMKKEDPKRYRVAGLGEWGAVDGLIYENWEELDFNIEEVKNRPNIQPIFGLDFGYTNDETALFCGMVDKEKRELFVFDELYKKRLLNGQIFKEIQNMGYAKERIVADSAEPKSIDDLRNMGLYRITGARKGRDSINNGIQLVQSYKIKVHPRCVNFLTEINNYMWADDKTGKKLNVPIDYFNHLMDAMRYAMQLVNNSDKFSFA